MNFTTATMVEPRIVNMPKTLNKSRTEATSRQWLAGLVLICLAVWPVVIRAEAAKEAADDGAAAIDRISEDARYLSSPEREGRGLGTRGIELAADYIAKRWAALGLRTDLCDGGVFQRFAGPKRIQLGPDNRLALVHFDGDEPKPAGTMELKLGTDFSPLSVSASIKLDAPLVFVGYGITAEADGFDEYADLDVRGKAVIVLRHEPQRADPASVFNGTQNSPHAFFHRKLANARQHGVAAVIFCTDRFDLDQRLSELKQRWQTTSESLAAEQERLQHLSGTEAEQSRGRIGQLTAESRRLAANLRQPDAVFSYETALGEVAPCNFPVFHCRRSVIDELLRRSSGTELAQIERQIDTELRPQSKDLPGWRARGQTDLSRRPVTIRNVVAALEPSPPPAPEDASPAASPMAQTIVVGAHYDHLGYGGPGSLASGDYRVHPGADDNASGVAVLLEVAHRLAAAGPLPRRIVFVAFSGEEMGLLGSLHYVNHPPVALKSTVAMMNFDMVGRMTGRQLMILGCGSCAEFRGLLDDANAARALHLIAMPLGVTPSDQLPFLGRQIPCLHFFTGMHSDYHRPSDRFAKLNVEGMRQVSLLAADVITALARLPQSPQFTTASSADAASPKRAFLGGLPDDTAAGNGCRLMAVVPGGPAQRAGVQAGDVIVQLGTHNVAAFKDLLAALQDYSEGQRVRLTVLRGGRPLTFEITLAGTP